MLNDCSTIYILMSAVMMVH